MFTLNLYNLLKNKKTMINNEWLVLFDITKDKFQWLFTEHGFEEEWDAVLDARSQQDIFKMYGLMNHVWHNLPDDDLFIRKNPKGWTEFIKLLELCNE